MMGPTIVHLEPECIFPMDHYHAQHFEYGETISGKTFYLQQKPTVQYVEQQT